MNQHQQMNISGSPKVNVPFRDDRGKCINLIVDIDTTIEELYKKYMDKAPLYGHDIKDIYFIVKSEKLDKNDKTKIKYYFGIGNILPQTLPIITVYFLHDTL